MRIHTKLVYVWGGDAYVLVHEEGFDYTGIVALCKGDQTVKKQEEQQLQFNTQMMSIFQKQYGDQSAVLKYIQGKMQPIIDAGGTGYSPEALAAMRTSATDQISNQANQAQGALQANEFARGGRDLPSGVNAQLDSQLLTAEAMDKAGAQNNITLQNENLRQANYWNALNSLSGVGAQFNPQSYAGEYNQGSSNVAGLSKAYFDSKAGFGTSFMNSLGSSLGQSLGGSSISGGGGKGMSWALCWVAAAIWGENAAQTSMVRWYLLTHGETWWGKIAIFLYRALGQHVAKRPFLVKLVKPLFTNVLLPKAQAA